MSAAADVAPVDRAPGLERLFAEPPAEAAAAVAAEGEVPAWLAGTYYVNGPARFHRGEVAYRHWLDGDGMVCALRFDRERGGEGIRFVSRFVRSQKFVEEEAAGAALYRTFGTSFAGDRLLYGVALASPVNVSVYPFAGRLLAFGEQGLPWELDAETLATRGPHGFGRLNAVAPFSAHPKLDPATGELFNFGTSFSAAQPLLHLYRVGAGGVLADRFRLPLDAPRSLHDFGLSERFAIFHLGPYFLEMDALMGGATVFDALAWRPEQPTRLLVVDRATGKEVASAPIATGYCLHQVNAFERPDGRLVVDVVELEEPVYPDYRPMPELFVHVKPARPVRFVVDLGRGVVERRHELPYSLAADFPNHDPALSGRPYRRFWMLAISATGKPGRKFLDRLDCIDWDEGGVVSSWQAPHGTYLGGEPVFAGEPGGDGTRGVVLAQLHEPAHGRSAIALFDAAGLDRGPVARVPLPGPIAPGFHAYWAGAS